MIEARILVALLFVLITPGAALLSATNLWGKWFGLHRLSVVIALSISSYPILFYFLKISPISFALGPYPILIGFVACWVFILLKEKKEGLELIRLKQNELIPLFIFLCTLFTRFWVAYENPYPAWTDSVHHAMLTKLIAANGVLPSTLEPYYPVPLDMYHLGLHAIAAIVVWVAQVPSHSALLWTAQALNGLCGLGVYFVLDRKIGRIAAITGAVVVGIVSYQPAFYVNWGRFTQAASQSLLLIAWLMTFETIQKWKAVGVVGRESNLRPQSILAQSILCAIVNAGMLLIHFRVAAFYLLLLAPSLLYLFWKNKGNRTLLWQVSIGTICIGVFTLILVAPGLVDAITTRIHSVLQNAPTALNTSQVAESKSSYFEAPIAAILELIAQQWLLWLFAVSTTIGLALRNKLVGLCTIWIILLCCLGNMYLLGIPFLNVVNFSGTVIMFYLPISLVLGSSISELFGMLSIAKKQSILSAYVILLLVLIPPIGYQRVTQIEQYRFFVTDVDIEAMNWINENVPIDSTFAINTDFWLPTLPHGTDAGYWIPYFTNRHVSTAPMLASLAEQKYQNVWIEISRLVTQIDDNPAVLSDLYQRGVQYIYIGAKGSYITGEGLDASKLKNYNQLKLLYEKDGVTIFQILQPA